MRQFLRILIRSAACPNSIDGYANDGPGTGLRPDRWVGTSLTQEG